MRPSILVYSLWLRKFGRLYFARNTVFFLPNFLMYLTFKKNINNQIITNSNEFR